MAKGAKEVKSRIKAAANIGKITKAMELVSVSKMKKAVAMVTASRTYAREAWRVLFDLQKTLNGTQHVFFKDTARPSKVLFVLFSSDRGLCGSFHTNLFLQCRKFIDSLGSIEKIDCVAVGKKGQDFVVKLGIPLVASFPHHSVSHLLDHVQSLSLLITNQFVEGAYDHVFLVYTDFVSAVRQEPIVHKLLPLSRSESLGSVGTNGDSSNHNDVFDFVFEPDRSFVLESIVPRLLEVQIYQAALESYASEQAARMMAMKNAADSASEMVADLTFLFNQVRQAAITREIAEISAGKAVVL